MKIPNFRQEKNSGNCQAVCTQMILHSYGDVISIEELMNLLEPYLIGETGMHSQGPAIILAQRGYDVTYIAHDLKQIDNDIADITEKDIDKLHKKLVQIPKEEKNTYRREKIALDIKMIEAGVKYSNTIPTLKVIDNALESGIPVKIGVQANGIAYAPLKTSNHSVVVIGSVGDDYIIHDPNPYYESPRKISKNRLLMAWYLNGGRTLIVKNRKNSESSTNNPAGVRSL